MPIRSTFPRHLLRLQRHDPDGEGAGWGWRRQAREEELPAAEERAAAGGESADELEIERRWLLLVRIDPERFELFYDKYRGPLGSFIRHKVGDPDTAEDLVAETFLEAVDGLWRFRFQGVTFGAWLFRLARRRIARHYEQRRRRGDEVPAEDLEDVLAAADLRDEFELDLDRQLLALAIRHLEPIDQDIVILHYWEGLTLGQIGVILGRSEDVAKTRLYRARRRLASLLETPDVRRRLSREGRRALDALRLEPGRLRLVDGGDGEGER